MGGRGRREEGQRSGVQAAADDHLASGETTGQEGDGGELVLKFVWVLQNEDTGARGPSRRRGEDVAQAHSVWPSTTLAPRPHRVPPPNSYTPSGVLYQSLPPPFNPNPELKGSQHSADFECAEDLLNLQDCRESA